MKTSVSAGNTVGNIELVVGFSTLENRLGNLRLPTPQNNRQIIVAVQSGTTSDVEFDFGPMLAGRDDVSVIRMAGRGVTKSRNKVIEAAIELEADFLIFGDDDVLFDDAGVQSGIDYLRAEIGKDILLGRVADETGALRKAYPAGFVSLSKFNSARVGTVEIMVRVSALAKTSVRFDENFGAGAEQYFLGDEYIFVSDLLAAGSAGMAVPFVFCSHPAESSGTDWQDRKALAARAAVFGRVFGAGALFVRAGFAARKLGSGMRLGDYLSFVFNRF